MNKELPIKLILENLKNKGTLSPLEKDTLDTWTEICKKQVDHNRLLIRL